MGRASVSCAAGVISRLQFGKNELSSDHCRRVGVIGMRLRRRSATMDGAARFRYQHGAGGDVPEVGRAEEGVLEDAAGGHGELVHGAAADPELAGPALHPSIEAEGAWKRLREGQSTCCPWVRGRRRTLIGSLLA